jgi:cytochrome c oxidase subunit II
MRTLPIKACAARLLLGATALALSAAVAEARSPLTYLRTHGPRANPVTALGWGMLAISLLVILIVAALVLLGIWRNRRLTRIGSDARPIVERPAGGLSMIWIGTAVSFVVLLGSAVWSFATLGAIALRDDNAPFGIEVKGHQWWWEVRYVGKDAARIFTTANEIHIPLGQSVPVRLIGEDVIHSFWVPALGGKTDVIPGQQNITSLEATRPGVYRGQCTEYCGEQHAHMAFLVVAEPPEQFKQWWDRQLEGAGDPGSRPVAEGQTEFVRRCGACHTVRGTLAGGAVGPDLSHLMSRRTLASGILPNNIGYLSAWIADPQGIKPGSPMPRVDLTGAELDHIRSFLASLQ